ncbi:MAG: dihydropteroate synthase [Aquiluna sp.]
MVRVPALWGVLNVTPDSFSDGGDFIDPDLAIKRAQQMVADGASVIDVGAESTRPGAERVSAEDEITRLTPVVKALVAEGITVSVDTMRAETAQAMLELGVPIINDVSGGLADERMFEVIAAANCQYVLMHWRGHSDQMDSLANYDDVVAEVISELRTRIDAADTAGIAVERIMIDPGLGFAKDIDHNWEIITRIDEFQVLGRPLLVGASRKRFLGALLPEGHLAKDRDGVSAALSVVLAGSGIDALRVHEPSLHQQALEVWAKSQNAEE